MIMRIGTRFLTQHGRQSYSSTTIKRSFTTSNNATLNRSRLGVGGARLSQTTTDGQYASVIATSLQNGVMTFESGHGGEENLRRAFTDAMMYLKDSNKMGVIDQSEIILTARLGYRSVTKSNNDNDDGVSKNEVNEFPNDIMVEGGAPSASNSGEGKEEMVIHNISRQYVANQLGKSPLVEVQNQYKNVHLAYMVHNPETQGVELASKGASHEEIRGLVKERLTDSFVGFEIGVAENQIGSYGICSNGLSLPSSHPLHVSWEDVLHAASDAVHEVHGSNSPVASLSTMQLPANLLETYGFTVANQVKKYLASPPAQDESSSSSSSSRLPKSMNIFFTRPLTCFPDRGTGTGFPFKLVDYQIPTSIDDTSAPTQWTHQIKESPAFYSPIVNEIMAHFDATHLVEASEIEGRNLTTEERETLDGCRLIQSMIHDLDSNLYSGNLRSFAAYEEDLFKKVVPMIHDTFEELDEGSAEVLHRFFKGHGLAVRHAVAKTTRELLRTGSEGGAKYDIGDDQSLQEFALQYMLKQRCEDPSLGVLADRVIVGCPKPEHVIEAIQGADKLDSDTN